MTIKNLNSMPRVNAALNGWFSNIVLQVVAQTNDKGLLQQTQTEVSFKGVIQPLQAEKIQLKAEGQRSFRWLQIHCATGNPLSPNDRIEYDGQRYKVMDKLDYSLNGYIEYHCVEDFTDEL